ncbi:MAG: HAD family phosphatase [Anaerolineaceae bacterium]|nr:HAD family phosphatase [Anaerolineaceae bacterium]
MGKYSIKVILFDMGGVLIKTTDRHIRTKLAKQFNLTYEQMDALVYGTESAKKATLGEISETEHFKFVLDQLGVPDYGIDRFQQEFWGGDVLDEELVEFISEHNGEYRFGMLSNAMSNIRNWLNQKHGFLHLFDVTYFSAELGMAKPDPKCYLAILNEFKVKANEVIFIDDFIENIQAAKELGIHSIYYKTTSQTLSEINQYLQG